MTRGSHYIIVLYEPSKIHRVLRFLKKHGMVKAVVLQVMLEDARMIGTLRSMLGRNNSIVMQGYMPLPVPR